MLALRLRRRSRKDLCSGRCDSCGPTILERLRALLRRDCNTCSTCGTAAVGSPLRAGSLPKTNTPATKPLPSGPTTPSTPARPMTDAGPILAPAPTTASTFESVPVIPSRE